MNLGDMRAAVQHMVAADIEPKTLVLWFNRALYQLAPALYLLEREDLAWTPGTEALPVSIEPARMLDDALFTTAQGQRGLLRRLAVVGDDRTEGWWYDGQRVGLRPTPNRAGTLSFWYFRYPQPLVDTNLGAVPEGGPLVAQACIEYACARYYESQGDEVSADLARGFHDSYAAVHQQIAAEKQATIGAGPTAWS